MAPERDWTMGPAKWVAVGVLGAACVAGMTWTIAQKYPAPAPGPVIQLPPAPPHIAPPAPEPVRREVLAIQDPMPESETRPDSIIERVAENPAVIGVEGPVVTPPPVVDRSPAFTRIINVNTAPGPELELLPGIGPALAGRIIEHRQTHGPFRTVEELMNVRGIGPKTLEKLRPRVRVE